MAVSASSGLRGGPRPGAGTPVFERVVTGHDETFLWRCDDYPWERNVWNVHPEVEIHLVRHASGVALIGDHIGAFEPGHLAMVGGGLPHDWVTPTQGGEVIRGATSSSSSCPTASIAPPPCCPKWPGSNGSWPPPRAASRSTARRGGAARR